MKYGLIGPVKNVQIVTARLEEQDGQVTEKPIFTREYDKQGNWTRELVSSASSWDTEFGLSTSAQVTRRLITYW